MASSIKLLTGLIILNMGKYYRSDLEPGYSKRLVPNNLCIQGSTNLSYLRILNLSHNHLVEDDFPSDMHNAWLSLDELDLSDNFKLNRLPASISHLSHLKYLNLKDCIDLKEVHELPPLIQILRADRCTSLQKIEDLSNKYKWLFKILLHHCPKLLNDEESQSHLANLLMKSMVQKCAAVNHRLSISVLGRKIPNWFSNQRFGHKITLNLPQNQITEVIGLAVCCLLQIPPIEQCTYLKIKFKRSGDEKLINRPAHAATSADHVWIWYMSIDILQNLSDGFESEDLIISFDSTLNDVVECGVCVVYKDDIKPMTRIGSWIPDYEEKRSIDFDSVSSENLQHGRWFTPNFFIYNEKTRDQNIVEVVF